MNELVIRFTSQTRHLCEVGSVVLLFVFVRELKHTRFFKRWSCSIRSVLTLSFTDTQNMLMFQAWTKGCKCAFQVPWIMPAKTSKSSTAAKRAAEARDESDDDVSAPAGSSTPPAREHGKTSRRKFLQTRRSFKRDWRARVCAQRFGLSNCFVKCARVSFSSRDGSFV